MTDHEPVDQPNDQPIDQPNDQPGDQPADDSIDDSIDGAAVVRGAVAGAVIALPAAIVQNLAPADSSLRGLALAVILVALGWCGWVAAKAAGARVIVHGALAALAAFAIVQTIGVVLRVARGDVVHPVAIAFTALLSTSCGMIGAELGSRREQRRLAEQDDSPDEPDSPDGTTRGERS